MSILKLLDFLNNLFITDLQKKFEHRTKGFQKNIFISIPDNITNISIVKAKF